MSCGCLSHLSKLNLIKKGDLPSAAQEQLTHCGFIMQHINGAY